MAVAPPAPRWPSLNGMRAFEAAARLGGFAAAAIELNVTPGAIAASVKQMEQDIGARLFERHSRGVTLSETGAAALTAMINTFDRMGLAVQALRRAATPLSVHIAALPVMAQLWLSPRLPALRAALPGFDVSVSSIEAPPDLKRVPFDISIFVTDRPRRGASTLAQDLITPVCAPAIAERLSTPEELAAQTFLIDSAWHEDWARWFQRMAIAAHRIKGPIFSLYSLAVDEAVHGAGVLMGHIPFVQNSLDNGALVMPFPHMIVPNGQLAAWLLPTSQPNAAVALVLEELKRLSG